jgi:hypothetical protein
MNSDLAAIHFTYPFKASVATALQPHIMKETAFSDASHAINSMQGTTIIRTRENAADPYSSEPSIQNILPFNVISEKHPQSPMKALPFATEIV